MDGRVELIINSMPALLRGTVITIQLTVLILIFGLILGLILAFGETYGNKPIQKITALYGKVIRSIPELVLLLLVFYGLPNLGFRIRPFSAAVLGLGIRASAYMAQIFRGTFKSVSSDQITAAYSIGMGKYKTFFLCYISSSNQEFYTSLC